MGLSVDEREKLMSEVENGNIHKIGRYDRFTLLVNCLDMRPRVKNEKESRDRYLNIIKAIITNDRFIKNKVCSDSSTPWHIAAANKDQQVVEFFLETINTGDRKTSEPSKLHLACTTGKLQVVKFVAEMDKSQVNVVDKDNRTPLLYAIDCGYVDIVKYLLEIGAEILIAASKGYNALHRAAYLGYLGIAEMLITSSQTSENLLDSVTDNYMFTPMYVACCKGHSAVVNYLFRCGADANFTTKEGRTMLHAACAAGNVNVVKVLVNFKRLVLDEKSNCDETPMYEAALNGHTSIVEYLLACGAKPCIKKKGNFNVLYIAAFKGHLEVVKVLVSHDKELVNSKAKATGKLPIHAASENGHYEVVVYLAAFCNYYDSKDNNGWNAFNIACQKGHLKVVKALYEYDQKCRRVLKVDLDGSIHIASKHGHTEIASYLQSFSAISHAVPSPDPFKVANQNRSVNAGGKITTSLPPKKPIQSLEKEADDLKTRFEKLKEPIPKEVAVTPSKQQRNSVLFTPIQTVKPKVAPKPSKKEIKVGQPVTNASQDRYKYDVMLSYQWDSQPFVLALKMYLEGQGLKVWIDVQEMYGNIISRMQEGVKNSNIIILCMTKKYERSKNCSIEYNYAFKHNKEIIPIKLEDFEPENELEVIILNKLYYCMFNEKGLENQKKQLLTGIMKVLSHKH